MIGIDTNVLLRYVAQDDPVQSAIAKRFVDGTLSIGQRGYVSLPVLVECLWVLGSRYQATREELVEFVSELLSDARFEVQDGNAAWLALEQAEASNVDVADALITFVNTQHGCSRTVTFDRRARLIPGMTLLS